MNDDPEEFDDTVPVRRGETKPSRHSVEAAEHQTSRRGVLDPGNTSGIGRHVPVVYGARAVHDPVTGNDGEVGAPPLDPYEVETTDQDALATSRQALPSLERRENRARKFTLVAYGAAILVSVLGLCVIAALVFG